MIEEIIENKLDYASLLCKSDPNINLVENYLRDGRLFAYFEKQTPLAFIAVKEINDTTLEIKNLLTLENNRGRGYGKSLLQYIENLYQNKTTFLIGTANSSMTNIFIQSLVIIIVIKLKTFSLIIILKKSMKTTCKQQIFFTLAKHVQTKRIPYESFFVYSFKISI